MLLLVILTALAVSMLTTPLMMRLAPRLRMVDLPDIRKVHAVAIPRVGGIGIVAGALVSAGLWMEPHAWFASYAVGSAVLLLFGAADDSMELGHGTKFVGQFIAAIAVVYWGDIWVAHMPFMSQELAPAFGKPFTVIALVGVINAINHSDGLDGLAGGESLLSLGCIAYLAYLAGSMELVALAAAVGGGVFGFLRFNNHPARVFMGDAGSQFLGFSLGVLVVLLTQQASPGLSMALPPLIIGLPIIDILAVLAQRIYRRMNWFRATRNHIHHRLLALGFTHGQSVVAIYAIQLMLVLSAAFLSYESDPLVAGTYLITCALVFAMITAAERSGQRLAAVPPIESSKPPQAEKWLNLLRQVPLQFVKIAVPLYIVVAGLLIERVPVDFAFSTAGILALIGVSLLLKSETTRRILLRLALYSGVACEVILLDQGKIISGKAAVWIEGTYFALLALAVAIALRLQQGTNGFRTTPLDFLLTFAVVAAGVLLSQNVSDGGAIAGVIVRISLLFYACELAIAGDRTHAVAVPEWSLIGATAVLLGKTITIV